MSRKARFPYSSPRRGTAAAPASLALAALLASAASLTLAAAPAAAQGTVVRPLPTGPDRNEPVLFKADEITYDDELSLVTARGHVEITQGEKIVLADRVTYNRRTAVVTAQSNVVLLEPGGNTAFADYLELTDDFKEGVIEQIRVLLADGSRMAANDAERSGGNKTVMRRAVYSPCEICKENPDRPPVWQMKAERVIHDQAAKEVTYEDATLEVLGVPVFYLPTFSHPDPSVKRKSGFLAPSYGHDSDLGYILRTPYYWSIAPNEDATITPYLMSGEGAILMGEHRRLFTNGSTLIEASGGMLERQDTDGGTRPAHFRGAVRARGDFDLDDTYRANFDLYRSTDSTYLRKFNFDSAATLRSRVQLEGFDDRRYLSVAAQTSQEQRLDVAQNDSPTAIPDLYASWQSHPTDSGDLFTLEGGTLALLRDEGTQSRRVTSSAAWRRPWTTSNGQLFEIGASFRADGYSVNAVPNEGGSGLPDYNGFVGRVMPQLTAGWRLPLVNELGSGALTLEPRTSLVISPRSPNSSRIPNEDSQDTELDINNLFEPNRFQGWDRIEGGQRVNYGLSLGYYGPSIGRLTAAVGQSYRTERDNSFAQGSGLETRLSDIVGGVEVSPDPWLDLYYRFRMDKDSYRLARSELGTSMGPSWLRLDLDYADLNTVPGASTPFFDREQVNFRVRTHFADNWTAYFRSRYDLADHKALVSQAGIRYMDECLIIEGLYARNFLYDADIPAKDAFYVRLVFKNYGDTYEKYANVFGANWRQ